MKTNFSYWNWNETLKPAARSAVVASNILFSDYELWILCYELIPLNLLKKVSRNIMQFLVRVTSNTFIVRIAEKLIIMKKVINKNKIKYK